MEYIDLGLPSGTLWADSNEDGFYTFDEVVEKYRDSLPTKKQFEELKNNCQWEWMGDGYKVTGPNGSVIVLPAEGIRFCDGNEYYVGSDGFYWSSTPNVSDDAWRIRFDSIGVVMYIHYRCYGLSVRLVKNTNNDIKNKELNIAEILKDCPKGMRLYATMLGECTLEGVTDKDGGYPITVRTGSCTYSFTAYGKVFNIEEAECQLFPSKDNRDWSTFNAPKKKHEFKPFERVLVRVDYDTQWFATIFSHIDENHHGYKYGCCDGGYWKYCIPYEGNEDLLGTANSPKNKIPR